MLRTSSHVGNGFKVAVRILQVDKIIMVSWPGGSSFCSFQWLEDLPEVLMVAERRVDGDWSAEHRSSDEYLDIGAPYSLAVDAALVDVVRLSN